jgi:GTP-binding protein
MRFVDEVVIDARAGDGGNGCVAFRREANVPLGGPSGGDGGNGGDVVVVVDPGLSTLLDLRYQRLYRAERGRHGQGRDRHGRGGASKLIGVPCGTLIYHDETGEQLADLTEPGQRVVVARGGRGGRGNMRFVSPTHRAPREADPGGRGQQHRLRLELKLLAEVGLVGLPNAGKSTLVSVVSAARPKVADYPFTTLVPNLGMVRLSEGQSFVIADIPGLIAGAAQGAGLGHRFLRHVERTRVLVFLLDDRHPLLEEPGDPLEDLAVLRRELGEYQPTLLTRQSLVVLNKADLLSEQRRAELQDAFAEAGLSVRFISAATRAGVSELLWAIWQGLDSVGGAQGDEI